MAAITERLPESHVQIHMEPCEFECKEACEEGCLVEPGVREAGRGVVYGQTERSRRRRVARAAGRSEMARSDPGRERSSGRPRIGPGRQ